MLKTINSFANTAMLRIGRFAAAAKEKLEDDSGVGVIEVILILLVLVGLVLIFKSQITSLAKNIFSSITSQVSGV